MAKIHRQETNKESAKSESIAKQINMLFVLVFAFVDSLRNTDSFNVSDHFMTEGPAEMMELLAPCRINDLKR